MRIQRYLEPGYQCLNCAAWKLKHDEPFVLLYHQKNIPWKKELGKLSVQEFNICSTFIKDLFHTKI